MQWRSRKPSAPAGGDPDGGVNVDAAAVGEDGEDNKKKTTTTKAAAAAEAVIIISVPVHCDGCARKLRRSVQRLDGVEEVTVDCRTNTVVVRGLKAEEDPAGVLEVVERRTGKKALLLSSSPAKPPPSSLGKKSTEAPKRDAAEHDTGKEMVDEDMEMVVVMRIDLHCEACCEEINRRILKIKGVDEVVPHMKSSQVMVRGKIEPATLVGHIHKWTGRRAAIIRAEPLHPLPPPSQSPPQSPKVGDEPPPAGETPQVKKETKEGDPSPDDGLQEKKGGEADEEKKEEEPAEKKGGGEEKVDADPKHQIDNPDDPINGAAGEESHNKKDHMFRVAFPESVVAVAPESQRLAMNNLHQCYYYPAYPYAYPCHQYYQYPQQNMHAVGNYPTMYGYYPYRVPEAFSDENPNICTVM
uniref:HMA domain-containing protein n=1 Tax=Leersia perrieri TaxID=77586 RepID=A0A0D9WXU7_9ORYZ